jgi:hypothetical protein
MLIPDDSYFRRMQAALSIRTRLELDALVFSSDVISVCYTRLAQLIVRERPEDLDNYSRVAAISDAWSVIDQVHVIRQIFQKNLAGRMGPMTSAWHASTEAATLLRNGMDHIAGNLTNLARRSGSPPPVLGALFIQQTIGGSIPVVKCLTLTAGQCTGGTSFNGPPIDSLDLVDRLVIEVQAFNHRFNLTTAVASLAPLLSAMAERVENDVNVALDEQQLSPAHDAAARAVIQTHGAIVTTLHFNGDDRVMTAAGG